MGRNRIKRVLRDATRHLRMQMKGGDFVVVARAAAKTASNDEIRQSFERLLRRAGALPPAGAEVTIASPGNVASLPMNTPGSMPG